MMWDANLVEQAMQLAYAAVDLLRQVAGVHVGGGVQYCLSKTTKVKLMPSGLRAVQASGREVSFIWR